MRAAVYDEFGAAGNIRVGEVDDPPVGPDTVLVRARATSVNPVDWKIREGYLQGAYPHHLPIIPGWDVAGDRRGGRPGRPHRPAARATRSSATSAATT